MQKLIEIVSRYLFIVTKPLLKHPEQAQLRVARSADDSMIRFRLVLPPQDVPTLIGHNGMTASAIRSLAKAAGEKLGKHVVVRIISSEEVDE